ncbi:MAG: DUF1926 domain-containing protein [Candidatus Omnitrophica bacterium]|nr:DUF1926 domain-containing protein [Candidatus Omnitrophota bacterium]
MGAPVTLLMAIHCHQPIGNFGFVFEEAYAKAYNPFLRALERHPRIRLALHYSGCLLDWLAAHRPTFLERVNALTRRGQAELLASGYYEPILPMIPETDRQGQIAQMRDLLRRRFGAPAEGLWLTERIWEPDLPGTLSRAGIRYTMLDTNQFAAARPWLPGGLQVQDEPFWDLFGSYATDYAGDSVRLFPASKRLRYWLPFQPVERTIEWLKRRRCEEPVAVTFADDGEKFGLWPKTYQWVYEEGWLDHFFTALEREGEWLQTATFRDYAAAHAPDGRVYLPGGSYEEMLEWSGGQFRNFFTKYPEANAMQQKMLRVSRSLTALRKSRRHSALRTRHSALEKARQELYAGQCNCAYWHGVFGGLYLSHLRRAVYGHLIAAEALVDRAAGGGAAVSALDADGDGQPEASLKTASMQVVVDPAEGGTITEWSLVRQRVNLLDTLTRRPERYHDKLNAKAQQAPPPTALVGGQAAAVSGGNVPASIHDLVGTKEDNLASRLLYDDHRRSAFHDYAFAQRPALQEVVRSTWGERRLWTGGRCDWERSPKAARAKDALTVLLTRPLAEGRVRKTIRLATGRPVLECRYEIERPSVPVIGLEFNLSVRDPRYLSQAGALEAASAFELREEGGLSLRLAIDPPATLYHVPVETVSESEEGLERTYQGLCLVCLWDLPANRGHDASWAARLTWTVS